MSEPGRGSRRLARGDGDHAVLKVRWMEVLEPGVGGLLSRKPPALRIIDIRDRTPA